MPVGVRIEESKRRDGQSSPGGGSFRVASQETPASAGKERLIPLLAWHGLHESSSELSTTNRLPVHVVILGAETHVVLTRGSW
jgi:hypothetical protein